MRARNTLALCAALTMCAAVHAENLPVPDLKASEQAAEFERAAAPERLTEYVQQLRDVVGALRVGEASAAMEARMDADEWAHEVQGWETRRQGVLQERAEAQAAAAKAAEQAASADAASDAWPDTPDAPQSDVADLYDPWLGIAPHWTALRTTEGTEAFIAEWQPKLAAFGSQKVIEFNLGIAAMLQEIQQNQSMTADEIAQASELVLALQRWANRIDWNDTPRFRRAVMVAADTVRASKLQDFGDFQTLSYDDAITFLNRLFRGLKRIMAIYDLDPDPILASVTIDAIDATPTRAKLVIKLRALEVPMAFAQDLAYVGGRWMDASVAEMVGDWPEVPPNEPQQEESSPEVPEPPALEAAHASED